MQAVLTQMTDGETWGKGWTLCRNLLLLLEASQWGPVCLSVCVWGGVYQVLFEKKGRPMDVPIPYRREFSKVASPRSEGSLNILPFLYLVP